MDIYDLIEITRLRAIQTALNPTIESIWLMRCRTYSEVFHTPLHVVVNELDPEFVLRNLYERQYTPKEVEDEKEGILEELYRIRDPQYNPMSAEETEELVDAVINKELARKGQKKRVIEETTLPAPKPAKEKPKSGGMSFEDLEKKEAAAESSKMGFED